MSRVATVRRLAMALPLLVGMALPLASAPDAKVMVAYIQVADYTDARMGGDTRRGADETVLISLRNHIEKRARRYLAPGDTLTVDVLDIDLAGQYEPWRPNLSTARIMTGATWPSMKLSWTLRRAGGAITSGEKLVSDQNYLWGAEPSPSGPFYYDKKMLDRWMFRTFATTS